jgi:hypothetical protein
MERIDKRIRCEFNPFSLLINYLYFFIIACCKLFLKEYNVVEFREKDHEKDKKKRFN